MDYEVSFFDGEQRLPDTAPARYAFGRVVGAQALWDWEDEATEGEIDEFRLRFRNNAGATMTVYCNQAHVAALHAELGDLLGKFADTSGEPGTARPVVLSPDEPGEILPGPLIPNWPSRRALESLETGEALPLV